MSDLQRDKDLEQARARRAEADAVKKSTGLRMLKEGATIVAVMRAVKADRKTVKQWMEEKING